MTTPTVTVHAIGMMAFFALGAAPLSAEDYSIDILINPYHPGFVDSWLFDINNHGQATGYIVQRDGSIYTKNAVIYRDGNVQVLAPATEAFGGFQDTVGLSINDVGDVLGNIEYQPVFFGSGGTQTLISASDAFTTSSVGGLNDSGNALIGSFPNNPADAPPNAFSGLSLWNPAGTQPLTVLDPLYPYNNPPDPSDFLSGPSSLAFTASVTGLNNSNQFAAGINVFDFDPKDPEDFEDDVFNEFFTNAYIYDGEGGYRLLESPTPNVAIRPIDIDEGGIVFGWTGDQLALWGPDGTFQRILPDPGVSLDEFGGFGFPSAQRNNLGEVVALTAIGGVLSYNPGTDAWTDITPMIDGLGTGTFSSLQGFNDVGQFVGLVRPPAGGGVFGYVVSPRAVPEGGTNGALFLLALGALVSVRKSHWSGVVRG